MAQSARVIDITKTYTPIDPQQIEHNPVSEGKDAYADKSGGVVAYEGYNFLPTLVGYKSFFGTNNKLDIPTCPAGIKIDKILIFESQNFKNSLIILAEDGIWLNGAAADNTIWDHAITLFRPTPGLHNIWTTAVIDDTLYCYRAYGPEYYSFTRTFDGMEVNIVTPTFLNMAGQVGIFKAGGRLGFWDAESSISWSSFDDHADFKPSVLTLAGSAIFNEVRGKITMILTYGDGFIVYATNSIVWIDRDLGNTFQWNPSVLMAGSGVAYAEQVVSATPDTTHYAYTGLGLHQITSGKIEVIATSITDLLRESQDPILLRLIENRYLCLQLIDHYMVDGLGEYNAVSFDDNSNPPTPVQTEFAEIVSMDDVLTLEELP